MDLDGCLKIVEQLSAPEGIAGVRPPSVAEERAVLEFARAVAHASERQFAPLAAFAAGVALAGLEPGRRASLLAGAALRIDGEATAGRENAAGGFPT